MMQQVDTTIMQFNSNMISTVVFAIWTLVKYIKNGDIPFNYQEGGPFTIFLLIAGCLVGFAAQTLMYFTSQRSHPALFSLVGQLGVFYSLLLDHYWFRTTINTLQRIGISILIIANILLMIRNCLKERKENKEKQKEKLI